MSDTVEVKLPFSESVVVIRNYTTRDDDERAEEVLFAGVTAKQDVTSGTKPKQKMEFPIANVMASERSYIPRLVQTIDGDSTNIKQRLGQLRTQDYKAIETAVEKIVAENSPKSTAAKAA